MSADYIFTMDVYPQQTKEQNRLYEFYDHLRQGKLVTTQCQECQTLTWPPRLICPQCVSDRMEWVELSKTPKVAAFTEQYAGVPPGYETPLMVALLDFGNGTRFMSRIVNAQPGQLSIGAQVQLKVLDLPDGRVVHVFEPK